jgi:hypothetical protein
MKTLLYIAFYTLLISCQSSNKKENIDVLEVYYMAPRINTPADYSCEMISKDFLKDEINHKKVTKKEIVEPFMKMFNNYKVSDDTTDINVRIKVLVYHNNTIDTLCLGEHFNTYKNGTKMIDNSKLLAYIKKVIDYDNTVPFFVRKHPERYHTNK